MRTKEEIRAQAREQIFTEEGQREFLRMRDSAKRLLNETGAFMAEKIWHAGDSEFFLACLDRMVELGEIECLSADNVWAQHKIYARPWRRP